MNKIQVTGLSQEEQYYFLRSIIFFANIDVYRYILVIDISILVKSNMDRRKYSFPFRANPVRREHRAALTRDFSKSAQRKASKSVHGVAKQATKAAARRANH
jgi:hypothetical protein